MLLAPAWARETIKKAGSTPLINYGELIIRMIPAAGLVVYADLSKFPELFRLLGWFILATSVILLWVPRTYHHGYALWCAKLLTPGYIRLISPFSFLFGGSILYAI